MSEPTSNSFGLDSRSQYALQETVDEVLECCAPHQRALLSVLSVTDRSGIDPIPIILALAEELPRSDRRRAMELAERMTAGAHAVDALEQIPNLLPSSVVLALQLANKQGSLPELYSTFMDRYAGHHHEPYSHEDDFVPMLARTAGRILAVWFVVMFICLKIAPEFQKMFEEFELELPPIMNLFLMVCDRVVTFWFVPFLLTICLMPFLLPLFSRYFRRLRPLKWRQLVLPSVVIRRRCLALVVQSTLPLKSVLSMVTESDLLHRLFPRLLQASEKIENGENEWKALASERIVSKREVRALALASSGETQAWLLRRSAENLKYRRETRTSFLLRLGLAVINLVLVLIVALAALAIFASYLKIAASIN